MLMKQWCERTMPTFPIFVFDAVRGDYIFVHGCRRVDGFSIVFFPQLPHWTIICHDQEERVPHAPLVYFGDVPLDSPDIYWHFRAPTPMALVMHSQGRACMCQSRCQHEPVRFHTAPSVGFGNRGLRLGHQLVVVAHKAPYSRGKGDHLYHREVNHVLSEEEENCWSMVNVNLSSVQYVTLFKIRLAVYKVQSDYTIVRNISLVSSVASFVSCLARIEFRRKGLVEKVPSILPNFSMCELPHFPQVRTMIFGESTFQCFLRHVRLTFSYVSSSLSIGSRAFTSFLSNGLHMLTARQWFFVGTLSLFHMYVFHRLTRKFRYEPRLASTWLPVSLSSLPFSNELVNRTAMGTDALACRNLLRRALAEYDHPICVDPVEVERWIDNVTQVTGTMPVPTIGAGICHCCMRKRKLKKLRCSECRSYRDPPYDDVYFGLVPAMYPLVEQHPLIPLGLPFRTLRRNRIFQWDGVRLRTTTEVMAIYNNNPPSLRARGLLCGPMWLGVVVRCFPSTLETTLVAAAIRMAVYPANLPRPGFWEGMCSICDVLLPKADLSPVTPTAVLDNQRSGDRRRKLEECFRLIDEGFPIHRAIRQDMTMGAFVKLEKHVAVALIQGWWRKKNKLAPRLINNPKALLNALMSVYTLPCLTWLHDTWSCTTNVYYAGCSPPGELNTFLSRASVNRYILEDDVSMMDGSHSLQSQRFFRHCLLRNFKGVYRDRFMELLLYCQDLYVVKGKLRLWISGPNPSGVPVTSLLNSITTAFVRVCALYYAYTGVDLTLDASGLDQFKRFLSVIYTAVAGDDGCTFLPARYGGVETFSPEFMERYIQYFSFSGFDVGPTKIKTHLPDNWRLHTFLAMRPYWSGQGYEYGVEISRRMKAMFWMLDKNHHPLAWGRGVATSLLKASRHVPVVSDICRWYLSCTRGVQTTISVASFTNPYSSVYGYEVMGDLCERTVEEFCCDYEVPRSEYDDFLVYLWSQTNPLINLDHPLLWAIARKE